MFALGSPGAASGKEHACQCRRGKRLGFDLWVRSHALEEGMATCSSILARIIPGAEEPGRLQSMGSQSQTQLSDSPCTWAGGRIRVRDGGVEEGVGAWCLLAAPQWMLSPNQ